MWITSLLTFSYNLVKTFDNSNSQDNLKICYGCKWTLFTLCNGVHELIRVHLPKQEARFIFRQLCEGLSYCHSLGISHRDLMISTKHMDVKIGVKFVVCFYSIDKPSVLIFNLDFGLALDSQHQISDTSCGFIQLLCSRSYLGMPVQCYQSRFVDPVSILMQLQNYVYYHTTANI